ncbi:LysR family transcriptional regulator, hydrogen peroxide-inducible genes activator [Methylobacillus rhizosphaerae]|uniref:LysR family transcriptional regulator, hydrogen peroxide-inducible genes activator n=1 Tax=Methylobacillus rhizosphaerae TaxID=551994 RepID=A0A238ZDQ2_9PROT|nr:hydrogen peroxide-inducible genes activator [Methylobacillus rhizosphaerae]SNR81477.1 LysR family transcriptional regulator, hydrogen peroxide-inducible genes activator [Methylobacillus rhizosphaerae]
MTLSELKFIVTVARERNFRRAAEKCFVSQPALSLAVKKLEEELGVIIFERSHKDVAMTPIGEQIVAQANRTLEESNRIKDIARMGNNQLAGSFKLGVIYSAGPYLLPQIIPALRVLAPEMPLEVEENLTVNLETQLRNRVIDAAIIALPFDVPGVSYEPVYDEGFVVAVPDVHPWASRTEIHAEELADEKVLLLNSGHCFSNQVVLACPELSRHGEVLQGNSLETIRNMVASNLGITVLPCSAAVERYQNPLIKMIPFADPVPTRRMALAWRKGYTRGQAIECLLNALRSLQSPCLQPIE